MVTAFQRWLGLAVLLALSGCAGLQTAPQQSASSPEVHQQHLASLADIHSFDIQGRIGVQAEGKGFSGATRWHHAGEHDTIGLFSPLGGQVANIEKSASRVILTDGDGKTYQASDAETLTQQTMGWTLPMRGLPDWALGRPTSAPVDLAIWDAQGKLLRLKQSGWDIQYQAYMAADGHQLPSRITMSSPKLNLKLLVERWQLTAPTASGAKP
jgi:outer membrane lipoprotein LolB